MVFCLEPVQVNLHTVLRKFLLIELRHLESLGKTDEGKSMLKKVRQLLLVGLTQSNIWVEVLLRSVLLDEYLQEVGDDV